MSKSRQKPTPDHPSLSWGDQSAVNVVTTPTPAPRFQERRVAAVKGHIWGEFRGVNGFLGTKLPTTPKPAKILGFTHPQYPRAMTVS
jgi:hypothetical protein